MTYGRPRQRPIRSTSVRDGRGGEETCEWTTACSRSRSPMSAHATGSRRELEEVRRRRGVLAGHVLDRLVAVEEKEAAGLVRELGAARARRSPPAPRPGSPPDGATPSTPRPAPRARPRSRRSGTSSRRRRGSPRRRPRRARPRAGARRGPRRPRRRRRRSPRAAAARAPRRPTPRSRRAPSGRAGRRRGSAARSRRRASGGPSPGRRGAARPPRRRCPGRTRADARPRPSACRPCRVRRRARRRGRARLRSRRRCPRSAPAGSPRSRTGRGRTTSGRDSAISSASRTAPFDPSAAGERTMSAP